jgi:hypothetical protein
MVWIALEFFDRLERCSRPAAVVDAMRQALEGFGIDNFCLNAFANPGQRFDEVVLASLLDGWTYIFRKVRRKRSLSATRQVHGPSLRVERCCF